MIKRLARLDQWFFAPCFEGNLKLLFPYLLAFALLAFAFYVIDPQFAPAFAESPPDQAGTAPASHHRSVSESLGVASSFGNAPRAPVSYTRSLSETVGVTTGMQPPGQAPTAAPAGQTGRVSPAPYAASSNQRIDERFSMRNLAGGKADPMSRNPSGGTATLSTGSVFTGNSDPGSDSMLLTQGVTGLDDGDGGSETADHHSGRIVRQILAEMGAEQYQAGYGNYSNLVLGAQGLAFVVIAIGRSPTIINAAKKAGRSRIVVAIVGSFPPESNSSQQRVLVIVVVLLSVVSVISIAGPISGQAFADSNGAAMAYRSGATNAEEAIPKYREWNPSTLSWGSEVALPTAGDDLRFAWLEFSPVSAKRVIITLGNDGFLDSYVCDNDCTDPNSWIVTNNVVGLWSVIPGSFRPFDIEFERTSGDLVLVYDRVSTSGTQDLFYRIMGDSETSFGAENIIDDSGAAATDTLYSFIRMDSRRTSGSNAIGMIAKDDTNLRAVAFVWDGSSFGSERTLTSSMTTNNNQEATDIAYESSSGDLVAVATQGTDMVYSEFSASTSSWSTPATFATWQAGQLKFVNLVPNPVSSSNGIFIIVNGGRDLDSAYWSGSGWTNHDEHDGDIDFASQRTFDFSWNGEGSEGILVWGTATGQLDFKRFTAPGTFSTQGSFSDSSTHRWVQLAEPPNPTAADTVAALGITIDANNDVSGIRWDGGSANPVSTGDNGITADGFDNFETARVDFQKSKNVKRFVSDSVTASDSIAASVNRARSVSDSVGVTDSLARNIIISKSIADSMTVLDSLSVSSGDDISITDSVAISDSISVAISKPLADSILIAESALADFVRIRPLSENLQVSDAVARSLVSFRSLTDSLEVTEFVTLDDNSAAIAYRSNSGNGANYPKYREWLPDTLSWSSEVELPSAGDSVRYAWLEFSPVSAKRVIVVVTDGGMLSSYVCDSVCTNPNSWTVTNDIVDLWVTASGQTRPFDVEFERTSGDLVLVYDRVSTSGTQDLFYRIMEDSARTFGSENTIDDSGSLATDTEYAFIRMDARRTSGSNAIGMIALDGTNSDAIAFVWNGNSWGSEHELTSSVSIDSEEVIGVAYETLSGDLVVVAGEATSIRYNQFSASTSQWGTSGTFATWNVGNINWISLVPNPVSTSNEIFIAASGDLLDLDSAYWSGSAWTDHAEHDGAIDSEVTRAFDFSWNGDGSEGLLMWGTASGSLRFKTFTAPGSFPAESTLSDSATHSWVQLADPPNPVTTDTLAALGATVDSANDISGVLWTGSGNPSSTGDNGISTNSRDATEAFRVDFKKSNEVRRYIADSLTVTDTGIVKSVVKQVSDSISVTDVITKSVFKLLSDAVAVIDDVSFRVSRSLDDSFSTTDAITKSVAKPLSDSVAIADTISKHASKSATDLLTFMDDISFSVSKSIMDSLAITDGVVKSVSKPLSDTFGITDTISKAVIKPISDAVAVTDSAAINITRVPSDTLALADSVVRAYIASRTVSDSVAMTDAVTKTVSKGIADSVTINDAISKSSSKRLSDSIGITDGVAINLNRPLADSIGITDEISFSVSRSVSDSMTITDSVSMSTSKSILDSLGVADEITTSISRLLSDEVALTDAITKSVSKQLSDSVTAADAISINLKRNISDTLAVADSAGRTYGAARSATDSISIADEVSFRVSRSMSDSITLADFISKSASKSVLDNVTMADSIAVSISRLLSDDVEITDAIAKQVSKQVSDSVEVADAIAVNLKRIVSDSLTIADTVDRIYLATRSTADSIQLTDQITKQVSKSITDSLAVDDDIAKSASKSLSDSIEMEDDISFSISRTVHDAVDLEDQLTTTLTASRSIADGTAIMDNITKSVSKGVADSLSVTDQAAKSLGKLLSDVLTVADDISVNMAKTLSDALAIADDVNSLYSATRLAADNLAVIDVVTKSVNKGVSDDLAVEDALASMHIAARSATDNMAVTDSIAATYATSRSATEDLSVTDGITATYGPSRPMGESLEVTDSITASLDASGSVTESLGVTDQIAASLSIPRIIADNLAVTDSVSKSASKSVLDSIDADDNIEMGAFRSLSDSLTITDEMTKSASKQLSDSVTVSDDIAMGLTRIVSESLVITDQIARVASESRSVTDNLAVEDDVSKKVAKVAADELEMTDVISRKYSASRAAADNLEVSDAIEATHTVSRSMTDSIDIEDDVAKAATRSVEDSMSVSEDISVRVSRSMADSLGIADDLSAAFAQSRPAADSLIIADELSTKVSRSIEDNLDINEGIDAALTVSRSVVENVVIEDAINVSAARQLQVSDGVVLTDELSASYVPGRAAGDALAVTDGILISIAKPLSENLTVTDDVAKSVSNTLTDVLAIEDQITATIVHARSMSETLSVTDSANRTYSALRSAAEDVDVADDMSKSVGKPLADSIAATDDASAAFTVTAAATDNLSVTDSVTIMIIKSLSDNIVITDNLSKAVSKAVSDSLSVTEDAGGHRSFSASVGDSVAVGDSVSMGIAVNLSELLAVTDATSRSAALERSVTESLAIADAAGKFTFVQISDILAITDQAGYTAIVIVSIADGMAVSDSMSINAGLTVGISDSVGVSDAVNRSFSILTSIADSVSITDLIGNVNQVLISDSLAIVDEFTDIVASMGLNLGESLLLSHSLTTPVEGHFALALGEPLVLGDGFGDNIAAEITVSDAIMIADSLRVVVVMQPPPPPSTVSGQMPEVRIMTDGSGVEPITATEMSGTYSITDSIQSLVDEAGVPVYNTTWPTGMDGMTMVLPTFNMQLSPTATVPAQNGFMTPMVSNIPENVTVTIPVAISSSISDSDMAAEWMAIEYTTGAAASNFTLVISMLDQQPSVAEEPQGDVEAFYIDVRWVGDFAGPDLSDPAFFASPPTFMFAITDEWADGHDMERDGNGVPIIRLYLLDEVTGEWIEIAGGNMDSPTSAIDDAYTYTATLPHFSTYVVTGGADGSGAGGGASGGSGGGSAGAATITRSLIESLSIDSIMQPTGAGEEIIRDLAESIMLVDSQAPEHQRVIVVQNVTVAVNVADIRSAGFGTAVAILNFEITNVDGATKELLLMYSYSDPATGLKAYEGNLAVTAGAGESVVQTVKIPFTSTGAYEIMIEAESDDGTIAATEIVVEVPWLEVYIYVLTMIVIAIAGAPVAYVAYALRQGSAPLIARTKSESVIQIARRLLHAIFRMAENSSAYLTRVLEHTSGLKSAEPKGALQYPASDAAKILRLFYRIAGIAAMSFKNSIIHMAHILKRAFGLLRAAADRFDR